MRSNALRTAVLVALLALLGSCGSPPASRLLVAGESEEGSETFTVWAVQPGEELDGDTEVFAGVTAPLDVKTRTREGELLVNQLGRHWAGGLLLALVDGEGTESVVAGRPGERPTVVAEGTGLETILTSKGTFVVDSEGCSFTKEASEARRVGVGTCYLSDSNRWVVSTPTDGGPLEVRDLRSGSVHSVKGTFTGAVVTSDARVLAVEAGEEGNVARLIDARSGEVVSTVHRAERMGLVPPSPEGQLLLVAQEEGRLALLGVEGDGETTTITTAEPEQAILPVTVGDGVDYLLAGPDPTEARLMHWSPGHEPEKLLTGELTATTLGPGRTLLTRQKEEGLELCVVEHGRIDPDSRLVVPADTSSHLSVERVLAGHDVTHVLVSGASGRSYVRVDLEGDHSAAPVVDWPDLRIGSVDTDGTVALTGLASADDEEERLVVVGPHDDEATERARARRLVTALVRDGIVYLGSVDADGKASVGRVTVSGRGEGPETLWEDVVLGGAGWEENGGAADELPMDPVVLLGGSPTAP